MAIDEKVKKIWFIQVKNYVLENWEKKKIRAEGSDFSGDGWSCEYVIWDAHGPELK